MPEPNNAEEVYQIIDKLCEGRVSKKYFICACLWEMHIIKLYHFCWEYQCGLTDNIERANSVRSNSDSGQGKRVVCV